MQRTSAPNIAGAHLLQRARGYWRARFHATCEGVESFLERARGQLPSWLVVGFGAGIASWFARWTERVAGGPLPLRRSGNRRVRLRRRPAGAGDWLARASGCAGCALIWLRSEWVRAPRLERPMVATFDAMLERVEPIASKGDLRPDPRAAGFCSAGSPARVHEGRDGSIWNRCRCEGPGSRPNCASATHGFARIA